MHLELITEKVVKYLLGKALNIKRQLIFVLICRNLVLIIEGLKMDLTFM